jgi:cytochrome c biogenesis protein CcdA
MEEPKESTRSLFINPRIALAIVGFLFGITVSAAFLARMTGELPIGILSVLEGFSSNLMTGLTGVNFLLSSGFAFVAGMASVFNPCGFPLLPVYLGLYMNADHSTVKPEGMVGKVLRPLLVGGTVALGLVVLFGLTGLVLGVASQIVVRSLPLLGLGIGGLLVLGGWWTLCGQGLHSWSMINSATYVGKTNQIGVKAYFLFGISFGVASLSCTLPIFLTVVGTTFTHRGVIPAIFQLLLYGCGMGMVIVVLTVFVALVKTGLVNSLERVVPYLNVFTGMLMTLAGCYLVFYWLTIGGIL